MSPAACLVLLGIAAVLSFAIVWDEAQGRRGTRTHSEAHASVAERSTKGRVVVLPGVYNTRFQLKRFVAALKRQQPGFDIEVRPWGVPLRPLHNVAAYERNLATANQLAEELAQWHLEHPDDLLYLVGYSGGGGLAVLTVAALPEHVAVDRLILIAPAISPDFPIAERVLPRVREFAAHYASERDLQVGWGTEVFGTIDRKQAKSAGAVGFDIAHPKLIEWHWSKAAAGLGHHGNHVAYLGTQWQAAALLPALDPAIDANRLSDLWAGLVPNDGSDAYGPTP